MIIELPEQFMLSNGGKAVEIVKGNLILYRNVRFEDLMYELTYALREKRCVYCGEELDRKHATLDHRVPQDMGGPTITNNLFPCCSKCNSTKSNLNHWQYMAFRQLDEYNRKEFRKAIEEINEKIRYKTGFELPEHWVEYVNPNEIKMHEPPDYTLRGKAYQEIKRYYDMYKKFPKTVISDTNYALLNGFNLILYAKDNGIKSIPATRIENAIIMRYEN